MHSLGLGSDDWIPFIFAKYGCTIELLIGQHFRYFYIKTTLPCQGLEMITFIIYNP